MNLKKNLKKKIKIQGFRLKFNNFIKIIYKIIYIQLYMNYLLKHF